MLTRPFYGIILGAWAFGYFPALLEQKARVRFFRPNVSTHKFYGICWKRKFLGRFVRVNWSVQEMLEALTEMVRKDPQYTSLAVKLDLFRDTGELTADELRTIKEYLTGTLVIPEPKKEVGLHIVADPSKMPRERKSRAKEQLLYAAIEHELRNPVNQKLFNLVSEKYGRDVCLKWWRHAPTRAAWEDSFADQLPKPESIKVSGERDLPPKPSQAEVAREMMKQFQEKEYLCDQQALHGKDV